MVALSFSPVTTTSMMSATKRSPAGSSSGSVAGRWIRGGAVKREARVAPQVGSLPCIGHRSEAQLTVDELALDARDTR
jgi:hypothetical protein